MPGTGDFAYVQARLQARHGQRPDLATWSRLEGAIDVPGLIHLARSTSLAPWVDSLRGASGVHSLERTLRHVWLNYIDAVAGWSPRAWRSAVRWTGALTVLPGLRHTLAGGDAPDWLREDPDLAPVADPLGPATPGRFKNLPFPALMNATSDVSLPQVWQDIWQSLWAPCSGRATRELLKLTGLVEGHTAELAIVDAAASSADSLNRLERGFCRIFRRGAQTPAAIFCHLGLCALDLQRLRGNLVTRALFPAQPDLHQWQ